MKKTLLLLSFCAAVAGVAAPRMELSVPDPGKLRCEARGVRGDRTDSRLLLTGFPDAKWRECELTLTPAATGLIRLKWRFSGGDGFRLIVADASSPRCELFSGAPATGGGVRIEAGEKEQPLLLRAGQPVRLKWKFRLESEAELLSDPGVAVVNDSGTLIAVSSRRLTLIPGYESCGVYLRETPDAKAPEAARLFYREIGAIQWREALNLFRVPAEKAWRGAIMKLKEDTAYETELELGKPGRGERLQGEFRTRSSRSTAIRNTVWGAFSGVRELPDTPESGQFRRFSGTPGQSVTGRIVGRGARRAVIDNFDFSGGQLPAVELTECEEIVLRNCRFRDFSTVAVRLEQCRSVLIEHCTFLHRAPGVRARALRLRGGAGVTVRHCNFLAADRARWNSAVECERTFPLRDADFYGNAFAFDDGAALDLGGGALNVRVLGNTFLDCRKSVALEGARLGPVFVCDNNIDGRDENAVPFPLGGGSFTRIFLHNSVVGPVKAVYTVSPLTGGAAPGVFFARNNRYCGVTGNVYPENAPATCELDADSELFEGSPAPVLQRHSTFLTTVRCGVRNRYSVPPYPGAGEAELLPNFRSGNFGVTGEFRPNGLTVAPPAVGCSPRLPGDFRVLWTGDRVSRAFRVLIPDAAFRIAPESGELRPDRREDFRVTVSPAGAGRRGAAVFQLSDGCSQLLRINAAK